VRDTAQRLQIRDDFLQCRRCQLNRLGDGLL
jgi:hypothetical protein